MGCNCSKGASNNFRQQQQRTRANLQSPRKPFIPSNNMAPPLNMAPPQPLSSNLQLPPGIPLPSPDASAERRRIQRLQQDAINRHVGR